MRHLKLLWKKLGAWDSNEPSLICNSFEARTTLRHKWSLISHEINDDNAIFYAFLAFLFLVYLFYAI